VSQKETNTTSDGTANVVWTLPKEGDEVTLTAEIKDNEGDHLNGSPIVFQVKISEEPDLFLGKWNVLRWTTEEKYTFEKSKEYPDYNYTENYKQGSHYIFYPNNTVYIEISIIDEENIDKGTIRYIKIDDRIKLLFDDDSESFEYKIIKLTEDEMIWHLKITGEYIQSYIDPIWGLINQKVWFTREDKVYFKR
jgi:hypothetical protein